MRNPRSASSQFIRNPIQLETLSAIVRRDGVKTIAVWAASTGDEPMSLLAYLADLPDIRIDGFDIQAPATFRHNIESRLKNSSDVLAATDPAKAEFIRAHDFDRDPRITLTTADLFQEQREGAYDMVLCQNMLVHYDPNQQRELLTRLKRLTRRYLVIAGTNYRFLPEQMGGFRPILASVGEIHDAWPLQVQEKPKEYWHMPRFSPELGENFCTIWEKEPMLAETPPKKTPREYSVCYAGWLGQANVGDEILFEVFQESWTKAFRPHAEGGDSCAIHMHIPNEKYVRDLGAHDLIVMGGGSILGIPYYTRLVREARRLGIPIAVWGSGIDGLTEPTVLGLRTPPVKQIDPMVQLDFAGMQEMMQSARVVGARGPDTLELLRALGLAGSEAVPCGDPGLLVTPPPDGSLIFEMESMPKRKKLVGINFGATTGPLFGGPDAVNRTAGELAAFADGLVAQGYRPVFFALWPADIANNQAVRDRMKRKEETYLLGSVYDGKTLTGFLKECEFTVNLKLHAAVLSAAAGTPFIALAYRSKTFDFARSIDSLDLTVSLAAPDLQGRMEAIHRQFGTQSEVIRERFAKFNRLYRERIGELTLRAVELMTG